MCVDRCVRTSLFLPFRLIILALMLAPVTLTDLAVAETDGPPTPDGVCHPVEGTGYIVTFGDGLEKEGLRIPVGTLSPLMEGDSLVVESGTITFIDFRNGQSYVFGEGTRLKIPRVIDPAQPSWWEKIEDQLVRSLTDPERKRLGGSVRRGQAAFWPDGGRFAPDLSIIFEWWRVRPAPALLRIQSDEELIELPIQQDRPGSGAIVWQPQQAVDPGRYSWALFDAEDDALGGGEFEILTAEEADAERRRYEEAARNTEMTPQDLAAAVLAAADRIYLW